MSPKSEHRLSADGTTINADLNKETDGYATPLETLASPSTPNNEVKKQQQPSHAAAAAAEATITDTTSSPVPSTPPNGHDSKDAAVAAAAAPEAQRTKLETTLVMVALCIALFLAALDMTIVTTAIPTISAHFHSTAGYVWIGSAYMLGSAALVPTWGKLSDIFGRKPILMTAVVVFWVGSLLCALSTSMGMLIAARAIQGVGGGGTIVLPNICVADLFSARKRGVYFGFLGMIWAVASAIGPIIGGAFTTRVSWRWCFWVNLPCGGLAFFILLFFLKLHNPRTPVKAGLAAIDWVGNILIVGGTIMLLMGLEFGGTQYPWDSATVICLLVFGALTIGIFLVFESRVAKFPVIPVRLFNTRTSVATYVTSALHAFTFISGSYYLPLYFQAVLGANSLLSGVYLLPLVSVMSLMSAFVGFFISKTGKYKIVITCGLFLSTLGFGLFTYMGDRPHWERIVLFQVVAGLGIGPNFQAPLVALQANVAPRDIGAATSSLQFIRQLCTATSVAVGGVVIANRMQAQQSHLAAELGPDVASWFAGTDAASNVDRIKTLPVDNRQIVRTVYWNALQIMFIVFTCSSFLGFLASFLIKQNALSKQHTEHKTGLQTMKAEDRGKKPNVDEETGHAAAVVAQPSEK
ncbi:hypothetical protein PWT90_09831 [Aphanocladium album]|nr:hypothetical protein PWT90_09831 [Aphanocladium album]